MQFIYRCRMKKTLIVMHYPLLFFLSNEKTFIIIQSDGPDAAYLHFHSAS